MNDSIFRELADIYQQLYLDPDKTEIEEYKSIVLAGQDAGTKDLSHFTGSQKDRKETVQTPAGPVEVITLFNRKDYETFVRAMMAAKEGPLAPVPATQGASTIMTFNWPRIKAHKEKFFIEEAEKGNMSPDWSEEFRRFRQVKSNYIDMLIVLSVGPYSNVPADKMGLGEEEWIERSHVIRKYHECTHFICRTLYPDKIDAIFDELVADAIGLYAAFGRFEPEKEKLFLGIKDGAYVGGRLENYVTEDAAKEDGLSALAKECESVLQRFEKVVKSAGEQEPFDIIEKLIDVKNA